MKVYPMLLCGAAFVLVGQSTCNEDSDGDGWTVMDGDCDDDDASIHPGADEVCDGMDNDCDGAADEGMLGSSEECAASSCQAILDSGYGVDGEFYWILADGASAALEAWCDMSSTDHAITLYTTQSAVASLDSTSILSTCPTGWTAYRYESSTHVEVAWEFAALMVASGVTTSTYYLANSFAGPEANCDSLQTLSGYMENDNWNDDGVDLNSTYGGFMEDNCNDRIHDPIPLDYVNGPSTTTGTTVLYNSYETSETFPVLCTLDLLSDAAAAAHRCRSASSSRSTWKSSRISWSSIRERRYTFKP